MHTLVPDASARTSSGHVLYAQGTHQFLTHMLSAFISSLRAEGIYKMHILKIGKMMRMMSMRISMIRVRISY